VLDRVYHREWDGGFYDGSAGFGLNESVAKEEKIYVGKVTNFYARVSVAEVKLETGRLSVGDTLHFIGKTTGLVRERVTSIHLDGKPVQSVEAPAVVGVKVSERVRPGDKVFLVKERARV